MLADLDARAGFTAPSFTLHAMSGHAPPTYKEGDKVLKYTKRRDTRKGDKLQTRFTGPYQIAEVLGRGVYRLMKDGDTILKQCVNAANLKPWVEQLSSSSPPATTPFCDEHHSVVVAV